MSSAALACSPKSAEAFRTISEVADELNVPQHVLRFWESRFSQIKPIKRAGGRRFYRPEDVDLLKGIQALLHGEGFTIKGVQKVLKERGVRHVAEVGRVGVQPAVASKPVAVAPVIVEKVIYVEKPAPRRRSHLRAVTAEEMSLPFFDPPGTETVARTEHAAHDADADDVQVGQGGGDDKAVRLAEEAQLTKEKRARLARLLDALTWLKVQLVAARGEL